MGKLSLSALLTLALLSLAGCATFSKGLSEEPTDQERGSRTFGAFIEDGSIERKVKVNLARASEELDDARIVVVSFNGNVLLAGQVANEALKQQATDIAKAVRHVRNVHNELQVIGNSSFLARTNDTWLTGKVKNRLYFNGDAPGWRTKVVTENGVVYLMGLLTREEAAAVVAQTQKVYGVQKIVKIIEYID